jgi:oligopeptide/dipeptide ABC transporter ATP-binding protein
LEVDKLVTVFDVEAGTARAVDGVSFGLESGKTLGLVGESGCGKSVTALSIMRLVPRPPGRIESGRIVFEGQNLLEFSDAAMRRLRGNDISMIFQEPMTSLNPVYTIGDQISEVFRLHQDQDKTQAWESSVDMLRQVGIPSPERRVGEYPHQLSGGMRQRVMIAMALACRPKLMIADEPTTALDVTIQAQILALMNQLRSEIGTSILLITHNLGVVAEMADQVAVMYAGRIVEMAGVRQLFQRPGHPYTVGLLQSLPPAPDEPLKEELRAIKGVVPSLFDLPAGCKFRGRCPDEFEPCPKSEPPLYDLGQGQLVRCFKYRDHDAAA